MTRPARGMLRGPCDQALAWVCPCSNIPCPWNVLTGPCLLPFSGGPGGRGGGGERFLKHIHLPAFPAFPTSSLPWAPTHRIWYKLKTKLGPRKTSTERGSEPRAAACPSPCLGGSEGCSGLRERPRFLQRLPLSPAPSSQTESSTLRGRSAAGGPSIKGADHPGEEGSSPSLEPQRADLASVQTPPLSSPACTLTSSSEQHRALDCHPCTGC